jgi:hypothetical protein
MLLASPALDDNWRTQMIRFLLGVVVGLTAARAMQPRQGQSLRGSARPETVGHVDELSSAAQDRAGVPVGLNAGDGTGGGGSDLDAQQDLDAQPTAQEGSVSRRSGLGSENFNGA